VTKALDFSLADRKAELLRWLSEEGRFAPDTGGLLEMLCEKLTALGAPIGRATVHVRTLHPEFRGVTRIWRRGQNTEIRTTRHGFRRQQSLYGLCQDGEVPAARKWADGA